LRGRLGASRGNTAGASTGNRRASLAREQSWLTAFLAESRAAGRNASERE
jgi:hypothetical protein